MDGWPGPRTSPWARPRRPSLFWILFSPSILLHFGFLLVFGHTSNLFLNLSMWPFLDLRSSSEEGGPSRRRDRPFSVGVWNSRRCSAAEALAKSTYHQRRRSSLVAAPGTTKDRVSRPDSKDQPSLHSLRSTLYNVRSILVTPLGRSPVLGSRSWAGTPSLLARPVSNLGPDQTFQSPAQASTRIIKSRGFRRCLGASRDSLGRLGAPVARRRRRHSWAFF